MIDRIRKFDIKKAGYISLSLGILNIIIHILILSKIMPYTWVNGGRSLSYKAACQTSFNSIIIILLNIPITLIASKIIPIKLNKFWTIVLIVWLWIGIPLDFFGILEQFLGTIFEKSCMSIVTIIAFMVDFRIAVEKRMNNI